MLGVAMALLTALVLLEGEALASTTALTLPRGFGPYGDPFPAALSGDRLVYRDVTRFSPMVVRVAGPNGQDRTLVRFTAGPAADIAGSADLVAVLHAFPGTGAEIVVGPPSGPLTSVSRCAGPTLKGPAFAVDGVNVAYLDDACGGNAAAVDLVVQSSSSDSAARRIRLPEGTAADWVSLAGSYVAYRRASAAGHEIVVDDWRTGEQAMRVSVGSEANCGATTPDGQLIDSFCGLAVQADGTVAELIGQFFHDPGGDSRYEPPIDRDTCGGTIEWYSPSDPHPHPIWSHACTDERIRIAAGRVLFATQEIVGIGVVDLAGHERYLGAPNEVYAFDGTNVYVNDESCTRARVLASDVVADPPLPFTRGTVTCPIAFRDARVYPRHLRLSLTVSCPNGCVGPVVVGTVNYVDAASKNFTIGPGGAKRITIRLPANSRIVRNVRGRRRVGVAINTFTLTFDPHKSALAEANRGPADDFVTAAVRGRPARSGPGRGLLRPIGRRR